jgi:hypothetical protein
MGCPNRRSRLLTLNGRQKREPTSGLEPLTPAHYECAAGRCRGLHEVANLPYLKGFPFSALPCVAPYCVPGGVKVVSGGRGSRIIGAFALNMRVGTGQPQPVEFTLGFFRHLRYGGSLSLINVEPRRFELLTSAVQRQVHQSTSVHRGPRSALISDFRDGCTKMNLPLPACTSVQMV